MGFAVAAGWIATSAVSHAQGFQSWEEICQEYLEFHPDDPQWADACLDAIHFWYLQNPQRYADWRPPKPDKVFPFERTQIPAGSHDGDRDKIEQGLLSGASADVIVEIDAAELRDEIHTRALNEGMDKLSPALQAEKAAGYALLKASALQGIVGVVLLVDYSNLPSMLVRITSVAALDELTGRPEVRAVFENRQEEVQLFTNQSGPLIHQPQAETAGWVGAGTSIAVLDSGVNHALTPFSCAAPGPGCRIRATFQAADDETNPDDTGHGTHVSSVAALIAEAANLLVADIFHFQGFRLGDYTAAVID